MEEISLHIDSRITSKVREGFIPNPKLKLLDQVSEVMRFKHYSLRTERTYREWMRRYIVFHGKRHPREMGEFEIERFLSDLAGSGDAKAEQEMGSGWDGRDGRDGRNRT